MHKLNERTRQIAKNINQENTVSVHVRRGDYQSPAFIDTLGKCCDIGYYIRAIDYMKKQVDSPRFVVFSDDMEWAKSNLPLNNAIYVVHNTGADSWQDMYLMSLCKHNIIANSSFSWWGAWLNENEKKIVIAPEYWWGDWKCKDVVPDSWMCL